MVGVPADFVVVVYKAGVDVLSFYELGQNGVFVLQHHRPQTLQLAFLFSEDIYLIVVFYLGADIRKKDFEILVENRLRRNMERNAFPVLPAQRNIQINPLKGRKFLIELPFLIHIGRIQPDGGIGLQ